MVRVGPERDSRLVYVDTLRRPPHPEQYSDRFRRVATEAGLPPIRLHALRYCLAFWLHSLGIPPADCAALLGRKVDVFMSIYSPEGGVTGAANAADVFGQALAAA